MTAPHRGCERTWTARKKSSREFGVEGTPHRADPAHIGIGPAASPSNQADLASRKAPLSVRASMFTIAQSKIESENVVGTRHVYPPMDIFAALCLPLPAIHINRKEKTAAEGIRFTACEIRGSDCLSY